MCMLRQFVSLVKNQVDQALSTMLKYVRIELGLDFFKLLNNISMCKFHDRGTFSKMMQDSHLKTDSLTY